MAAFDAAPLFDGALAYTREINDGYTLWKTPPATLTAAIDGVSVVAATGISGAVWARLFWRNYDAWRQLQWYLDAVNGSDANTGTSVGSPLKTLQELAYRLNGAVIDVPMRATLATGTYPSCVFNLTFGNVDGASLIIQGTISSSSPSAIATITNEIPTSNTRGALTSAGTFTLGQRLRLVTAATPAYVGAMTYVTRVIGAGSANVSAWAQISNEIFGTVVNIATPAIGDQYVVDTLLTTVGHVSIVGDGGRRSRIMIRDCTISPFVASGLVVRQLFASNASNLMTGAVIYACTYLGSAEFQECYGLIACTLFIGFLNIEGGHINLAAVVVFGALTLSGARVLQRGPVQYKAGLALQQGTQWSSNGSSLSTVDSGGTALSIVTGSVLRLLSTPLWGANNTLAVGVAVGMDSCGSYQTSAPVLVATAQVTAGGVNYTYADNVMGANNGAVWGVVS